MSKKKIIISLLLFLLVLIFEGLISGIVGIFGAILDILIIALFATGLSRIFSRGIPFGIVYQRNLIFTSNIFGIFSLLLLLIVFFSNTFPASLSEIVLTDGERKVVFLQMSHIGSSRYYDDVTTRITARADEGYHIYREGVLPGTPENQARFDALLGIKIHSGTYNEIARFIGLESQTDRIYSRVGSGIVMNVDLSIDTIMSLIPPTSSGTTTSALLDPMVEISRISSEKSSILLPYIARALLNIALRYQGISDSWLDSIDSSIQEAIINQRNQYVVDRLITESDKNIVIVYGALHFSGMYELLQQKNPKWHIVSLLPFFPYQP